MVHWGEAAIMETESAGAGAATAPVAETRAMRAAVNFILMVGSGGVVGEKSCLFV